MKYGRTLTPSGQEICTIYLLINSENGKLYVGQTWNQLQHRFGKMDLTTETQLTDFDYWEDRDHCEWCGKGRLK